MKKKIEKGLDKVGKAVDTATDRVSSAASSVSSTARSAVGTGKNRKKPLPPTPKHPITEDVPEEKKTYHFQSDFLELIPICLDSLPSFLNNEDEDFNFLGNHLSNRLMAIIRTFYKTGQAIDPEHHAIIKSSFEHKLTEEQRAQLMRILLHPNFKSAFQHEHGINLDEMIDENSLVLILDPNYKPEATEVNVPSIPSTPPPSVSSMPPSYPPPTPENIEPFIPTTTPPSVSSMPPSYPPPTPESSEPFIPTTPPPSIPSMPPSYVPPTPESSEPFIPTTPPPSIPSMPPSYVPPTPESSEPFIPTTPPPSISSMPPSYVPPTPESSEPFIPTTPPPSIPSMPPSYPPPTPESSEPFIPTTPPPSIPFMPPSYVPPTPESSEPFIPTTPPPSIPSMPPSYVPPTPESSEPFIPTTPPPSISSMPPSYVPPTPESSEPFIPTTPPPSMPPNDLPPTPVTLHSIDTSMMELSELPPPPETNSVLVSTTAPNDLPPPPPEATFVFSDIVLVEGPFGTTPTSSPESHIPPKKILQPPFIPIVAKKGVIIDERPPETYEGSEPFVLTASEPRENDHMNIASVPNNNLLEAMAHLINQDPVTEPWSRVGVQRVSLSDYSDDDTSDDDTNVPMQPMHSKRQKKDPEAILESIMKPLSDYRQQRLGKDDGCFSFFSSFKKQEKLDAVHILKEAIRYSNRFIDRKTRDALMDGNLFKSIKNMLNHSKKNLPAVVGSKDAFNSVAHFIDFLNERDPIETFIHQLETYTKARDKKEDTYHCCMFLQFTKTDKIDAAEQLIKILNGENVSLSEEHLAALKQGSLGDLVSEFLETNHLALSKAMNEAGRPQNASGTLDNIDDFAATMNNRSRFIIQ